MLQPVATADVKSIGWDEIEYGIVGGKFALFNDLASPIMSPPIGGWRGSWSAIHLEAALQSTSRQESWLGIAKQNRHRQPYLRDFSNLDYAGT